MSFNTAQSADSLMRDFLDVITCGFASALVLGLIFSIVQPQARMAPVPALRYYTIEFEVEEGAPGQRSALDPVLSYRDQKGTHQLPIAHAADGRTYLSHGPPDFDVEIMGFSLSAEGGAHEVGRGATAINPRRVWSVIFARVPESIQCDARVRLTHQSGLAGINEVTVRRKVTPGAA